MRTGMLVFACTASGVVGGVVGALLSGSGGDAAGPSAASTVRAPSPGAADLPPGDLDDLRNRIGALEGNLAVNAEETNRLRAALAEETKAAADLRGKVVALEEAGSAPGLPGHFRFGGPKGEGIQVAGEAMAPVAFALPERFRKAGELRALPEEERWAKARDALGLTTFQEEELKAAVKERADAMKDAVRVTAAEPGEGSGAAISIAMPDMEKMREARRKYDERVGKTLNAEQAKTWREEGYEQAMGGGGGVSFVTSTVEVQDGGAEPK